MAPLAYFVAGLSATISAVVATIPVVLLYPSIRKRTPKKSNAILLAFLLYLGMTLVFTIIGLILIFIMG
jgi:hypothetical protein